MYYDVRSCNKALSPLLFQAGQRSYVELFHGRRESLGTRLHLSHMLPCLGGTETTMYMYQCQR